MGSEALDTVNHPEYFIRCFSDSTIPKTTLAVHQSQSFLYVLLRTPGHQTALLHGNLQSSLFDCTLCKKTIASKLPFSIWTISLESDSDMFRFNRFSFLIFLIFPAVRPNDLSPTEKILQCQDPNTWTCDEFLAILKQYGQNIKAALDCRGYMR